MKRISLSMISAAALFPLLSACLQDTPAPAATESGAAPPVQDAGPAATSRIEGDSVFDSRTGTGYMLNPNWKRVTAGGPALAKGQGLLIENRDWSSWVVTRIYECSAYGNLVSVACTVEPDFVAVGGGAYADFGGGFLTESRPLDNSLQTWVASSKDHRIASSHTLHCYVIGLRIETINRATLMANMKLVQYTGGVAPHPTAGTGFPNEDYVVVGGGSRVNWQSYGNQGSLLTGSYPYFGDIGWYSTAKDHFVSNPATVTSYAVGMNSAWFYGTKAWLQRQQVTAVGPSVSTGTSLGSVDTPYSWVLTGPGGIAEYVYNGTGRLLYGIRPDGAAYRSVGVYSKDHITTCAGYSRAYAVQLRVKP